jgi:hypothetical protein
MQLSQLKRVNVLEDFGSSDWYGYMQDMKRLVDGGASIEDAAKDVAASVHDHLGYDDMDDTIARVIAVYKARNKIKEEVLAEGYDERVQAAVHHLIKKFEKTPSSKADLLAALHDYAAADKNSDAAEHNKHVMWGNKHGAVMGNGVPDYNGTAATRAEFVRDVLAGVKGRIAPKVRAAAKPSEWRYDLSSAETVRKVKPNLDVLYQKGLDAIGDSFPDGDPIDRLGPWLSKQGFDFEDMNKAFRKHEKKDFYAYLAHMWEDMARDQLHDAKNGHADENSVFYHQNDQGDWVLADNPWMHRTEQKMHRDKHDAKQALWLKKHKKQMADTKIEKPEAVEEGVFGSDIRDKAEYPDAKFDYANWKAGKPPIPGKKVGKSDPSKWNDLDKKETPRLDAARARKEAK